MEPARRPVVLIPPFVALAAALVLSLALHGPAYLGLGVLKQVLESRPRARSMEIEIVTSSAGEVAPASPEPAPLTEPLEEPADEPERARREREQPSAPRAERAPEPPPEPEIAPPAPVVAPPPPPPPEAERTAVLQRSRDPSVPPPPNARVRAAENNRVEEETIARAQSDQSTELEAQQEARGDAEEQVQADLRDAEGDDRRRPTPEEVQDRPRPDEAPSVSNRPAVARAAAGRGAAGGTPPGGAAPAPSAGTRARSGGAPPTRQIVVRDSTGTFVVRVPEARPEGTGGGDTGGRAIAGLGRGARGRGRGAGRLSDTGGPIGDGSARLRISWSDFTTLYGEEELARDREAYLRQRRSRTRGDSRQVRWQRFLAAIHDPPDVRPGNQTSLNAAADPFAAYIAQMHNRIHDLYYDFLGHMPSTVEAAYRANSDMHAKIEMAIAPDGTIDRVIVAATSGDLLFDFGAYNTVMQAQPFGVTPEQIRSPDGRTYVHWSFYRNERRCGTFNAQAFMLAAPARSVQSRTPPPSLGVPSLAPPSEVFGEPPAPPAPAP